jgi:hypothetical protein
MHFVANICTRRYRTTTRAYFTRLTHTRCFFLFTLDEFADLHHVKSTRQCGMISSVHKRGEV